VAFAYAVVAVFLFGCSRMGAPAMAPSGSMASHAAVPAE
jgi:hypothetical protein